ncbi:TPA: hypothetical protein ACKP97_003918 [Pseudomonas aeruginosa]|uniref:hypothetical protein n=1 Tax=Pseudomonas aeruginosa TaxID=287 RepID=UPI00071B9E29|nr:hypothetical protein [Pseudomonas aeruginosa]AZZ10879.1 hypothetical protein CEK59_04175 [Pseudomonas aeruginosa]EKN9356152.1 hypothetical protein [Pseudomonas aeruginosa]KSJ39161.1 hypothetical protein APA00_16085 [Pseudomonas aeruginosa]MBG5166823.1 hypothetical protein [Pseudomonas aeruginosa]MBK3752182.1 hypothetical protein [Pseudomonas aeruginosa]
MEFMDTRLDRMNDKEGIRDNPQMPPDSRGDRAELAALVGVEGVDASRIQNALSMLSRRNGWSVLDVARELRHDAKIKDKKDEEKLDVKGRLERDTGKTNETRQETWQLQNLAVWNAQMTTVGGVRMTNGEAQNARKHIIDNADSFADRAVQEGRIQASEKDEYKATIRRIYELKDREGRGIATEAEKKECEQLQKSRMGQEVENDTGRVHLEMQQVHNRDATVATTESNAAIRRVSATPLDESLFQGTPKLSAQFEQAVQPTAMNQPEQLPEQPAPRVAAMGLGL